MPETMAKGGAISGDKASKWQERFEAEAEAKELRRKAEGGDACAMCDLAVAYQHGTGVAQDIFVFVKQEVFTELN